MKKWSNRFMSLCFLVLSSSVAFADSGYAEFGVNLSPTPIQATLNFGYNFSGIAPNVFSGVTLDLSQDFGASNTTRLSAGGRLTYAIQGITGNGLYTEVSIGPEVTLRILPNFGIDLGLKAAFFAGYEFAPKSGIYGGGYAILAQLEVTPSNTPAIRFVSLLGPNESARGLFAGVYYTPIDPLKLELPLGLNFGDGVGYSVKFQATYALGDGYSIGGSVGTIGNFVYGSSTLTARIFAKYSF